MISTKYQKIYDQFIDHYKNVHIDPWHEIDEMQLEKICNDLIGSMDINDDYNFAYFMNYIIKRLSGKSDAHTKLDLVSLLPINFRIFGDKILINYPDDLRNSVLISINGVNIDRIINELEEVITYGTIGKRRYELEQALFNRYSLFGLPSLRNSKELIFEIEREDGTRSTRIFSKDEKDSNGELFDYNEYRYGGNATYRFVDKCLIYIHRSIQNGFKDNIESAISNLRQEDLSAIDTFIIDIRGNTGGNSNLNKILMDFIKEHSDKQLICLTDYRVFSSGRFALRDLINLGAVTIGEGISTPINCYGNSSWFNIDGYYFSISERYFHPFLGWCASSKEEFNEEVTEERLSPYIFKPDIVIEETIDDYVLRKDTVLNYAIEYSSQKRNKKL